MLYTSPSEPHDQSRSPALIRCTSISAIVTALVVIADAAGALDSLEGWLYDKRAAICQFTTPQPTDKLVHLDIDEAALQAIGRWRGIRQLRQNSGRGADSPSSRPWAGHFFSELEKPRLTQDPDGTIHKIDDDST